MTRKMSRTQRRTTFVELAGEMFDNLEQWYDENPEASFGEIESQARQERRKLMGTGLQVLINGRETGMQPEAPACPQCGQALEFEGYRKWTLHGLEGETVLERAYYVCSLCEAETFFPPG